MSARFDNVGELEESTKAINYRVAALAERYGLFVRQFERSFKAAHGISPAAWMHAFRMRQAAVLLARKVRLKDASEELGYKLPTMNMQPIKRTSAATAISTQPAFLFPTPLPLSPLLLRAVSETRFLSIFTGVLGRSYF